MYSWFSIITDEATDEVTDVLVKVLDLLGSLL